MEHVKAAESRFNSDLKTFDIRLMLSYVLVSVLFLTAIYVYALPVHPETDSSEFISTIAFP